jgi:hypothetical protein
MTKSVKASKDVQAKKADKEDRYEVRAWEYKKIRIIMIMALDKHLLPPICR